MFHMINYGWGGKPPEKKPEPEVPTCCIVLCTKCGCHYSEGSCREHGVEFLETSKKKKQ